jgi:hypothetical protein
LLAGAVQETAAEALPAVADTDVGAPGAVAGVTAGLAADGALVPAPLVAVTVNVYGVPLTRPITVQPSVAVVQVAPPGDAVTVYPVIDLPPLLTGAVHETAAEALPGVADTDVGTPGAVAGVTAELGADGALVPAPLVAVTVKVYGVPLTRPLTEQPRVPVVHEAPPGAAVTV